MTVFRYHGSGPWKYGLAVEDVVLPGDEVELTAEQVGQVETLNRKFRVGIHLLTERGDQTTDKAAPKDGSAAATGDKAAKK